VYAPGAAGVTYTGRGQNLFPAVTGNAAGNNLPGITGQPDRPYRRAPGYPHTVDGQLGGVGDGNTGADPRAPKESPWTPSPDAGAWGEGDPGSRPGFSGRPLPYGGTRAEGGWAARGGTYGDPLPALRPSWWRGGIQGFNDKLTVKDRHAYWDAGNQKTGIDGPPWGFPNTYNDPRYQPPMPELRTVNRTVSYQKGTDATRNQDDLTRAYTWVGEQGAGWTPVNGGVPGLYQPYGTRGGVPFPIVSPVAQGQPGDGRHLVNSGPPHGLHSQTPWKGGEQLIGRYTSTPQMRPVRVDRPSNSPQAGQSYSQTVRPQGASPVRPGGGQVSRAAGPMLHTGRGWAGRGRKGWVQ
jgi:hypothetical protein